MRFIEYSDGTKMFELTRPETVEILSRLSEDELVDLFCDVDELRLKKEGKFNEEYTDYVKKLENLN